jgi:hypothetical protein
MCALTLRMVSRSFVPGKGVSTLLIHRRILTIPGATTRPKTTLTIDGYKYVFSFGLDVQVSEFCSVVSTVASGYVRPIRNCTMTIRSNKKEVVMA